MWFNLQQKQKKKRVDISRVNLSQNASTAVIISIFNRKVPSRLRNFLSRFVTMDETWIHHFDPVTKKQSMIWKRASSPMPKKFEVSSSAGKVMTSVFWDTGIIIVEYLERGATILLCRPNKKVAGGHQGEKPRQTASWSANSAEWCGDSRNGIRTA